jgi:hypothetical protein
LRKKAIELRIMVGRCRVAELQLRAGAKRYCNNVQERSRIR